MPTIEIISLNTKAPFVDHDAYNFSIIEETQLISHRALFTDFLASKHGIMLHLGNIEFNNEEEGGPFFASDLINWDFEPKAIAIPRFDLGETGANQSARFQFQAIFQKPVSNLLAQCLEVSPDRTAYFYTDYQFGDADPSYEATTLQDFWQEHDKVGLGWNRLYTIIITT